MNLSKECHEITDCPGLYIDAFRGPYLRKTHHMEHAFILTHYHGDHYGNLPRDNKYQGPALIHCTPVTAALLRKVHKVPDMFLVEHGYGETFLFRPTGPVQQERTKITFYDANHCPGAAIVFIELANGTIHLHTGDMRYHDKMKSYPLLQEAALARKIDLLFLDTTYANPKYDFLSQEEAVDTIASQIHELLGSSRSKESDTLVLLSCYSIGKEKCLWEASTRCNQRVYVSERKLDMLQCIEGNDDDVSSQIGRRCTTDPEESDLHVIRMGLAGQMHPFFQPDFGACADYAREVKGKQYNKVVAFIPTGWADANNWNRKNSVSQSVWKGIHVEVRLVCYSEHSTFSELQAFVGFLKPRKIVPTVFSDENDKRRIEARFKVDLNRAKQSLIDTMFRSSSGNNTCSTESDEKYHSEPSLLPLEENVTRKRQNIDTDVEGTSESIASLEGMGFCPRKSKIALESCRGKFEAAIELLLKNEETVGNSKMSLPTIDGSIAQPLKRKAQTSTRADKSQSITSHRITDFFRPKP